jgi:hypothetical protein
VNFSPDNMGMLLTWVIIIATYSVALEMRHSKAMNVAKAEFPSLESNGYRKIVPCKESDCMISRRVRFKRTGSIIRTKTCYGQHCRIRTYDSIVFLSTRERQWSHRLGLALALQDFNSFSSIDRSSIGLAGTTALDEVVDATNVRVAAGDCVRECEIPECVERDRFRGLSK